MWGSGEGREQGVEHPIGGVLNKFWHKLLQNSCRKIPKIDWLIETGMHNLPLIIYKFYSRRMLSTLLEMCSTSFGTIRFQVNFGHISWPWTCRKIPKIDWPIETGMHHLLLIIYMFYSLRVFSTLLEVCSISFGTICFQVDFGQISWPQTCCKIPPKLLIDQ